MGSIFAVRSWPAVLGGFGGGTASLRSVDSARVAPALDGADTGAASMGPEGDVATDEITASISTEVASGETARGAPCDGAPRMSARTSACIEAASS